MHRGWLAVATGTVIILLITTLWPRPLVDGGFRPESQAIAAVRTIHTAQTQYFSQYGHYAGSLRELAPWLSDDLVSGAEGGYRFTLTGTESGYTVAATPQFCIPAAAAFIPIRRWWFTSTSAASWPLNKIPNPSNSTVCRPTA